MTFEDLIEIVRQEIIVDRYEDAFTNGDLRDVLWGASVDTARAFDLPRALSILTVSEGVSTVAAPADAAKIVSISIGGDDAVSAELPHVIRMRAPGPGPLKYFNFDPRRSAASGIFIAPVTFGGETIIEYTQQLVRPTPDSALDAASPWLGVLPQFHRLVAYRAATTLFQMDERENEVEHWRSEYQQHAAEMSAFLGRTDMSNLLIEPGRRNDEGARG